MAVCKTDTRLEECAAYFKSKEGFSRLFEKMKDKYRSFGSVNGTVILQNLSLKEKEALEDLLKKDFSRNDTVSITLHKLKKCIENSEYKGLAIEEILFAYFNESLLSNRQLREHFSSERNAFFRDLIDKYSNTSTGEWLEDTWRDKENAYRIFLQRYSIDKVKLAKDIDIVSNALENLPCIYDDKMEFRAFAQKIAGNTRAFDMDKPCGEIFMYSLMHRFGEYKPSNIEERVELYYRAGIILDDVSNFVLCNGLLSYTDDGVNKGWQSFYEANESFILTLTNIAKIKKIVSPWNKVFVVENSEVFSEIVSHIDVENVPMICTYGQLKTVVIALLDLLIDADVEVYYSGDFDPEGLMMADRLIERYGDNIKLWRYNPEDYTRALSNEALTSLRLRRIRNIKSDALAALAEEIRQNGRAGLQEQLIEYLLNDIKDASQSLMYSVR